MESLPSRQGTSKDVLEQVLTILSMHVTRTTAQSILTVARGRARMTSNQVSPAQLLELLEPLERGMRVFVHDPARIAECQKKLAAIAGSAGAEAAPVALQIPITVENDIARARTEARRLAGTMGFTASGQTRLATMVSELARNIVQYAKSGKIGLRPGVTPRGIEILAEDQGPGIPNLAEILAGQYRSRSGMGLGLLGIKRLSDPFTVETEAGRGTTVRAFLKVS